MASALQKFGTACYMLVMVFYGIYTMILSIEAYTKFENTTQTYFNIATNLSQKYVVDIKLSTTSCPDGYSTIFDWNWEGTEQGCDCKYSMNSVTESGVYVNACNSTQLADNCVDVPAQPAVYFDAIEGTSNSRELVCIKRGAIKFSDVAEQQTGTCTAAQKTCGNPSKPETVICVDSADPCPIYNVMVSNSVDLTTYPATEWTQLAMASGKYLYYNMNGVSASTLPSSEFRFTQKGVCPLQNWSKQLPDDAQDYVLSITTRDNCTEIDESFKETNMKVAENLYYQLNVPSSQWAVMSAWSLYDVPTSTTPFLSFQRQFINWRIDARKLMKPIVDSADQLSIMKTAQLTVMVINILVCLCVSIILQISQVYNLCDKDVPCFDGRGEETMKKIVRTKNILSYGSKLVQVPFLLWAFFISVNKKGMLNDAANAQPSDPRFNGELAAFADQLENDVYQKNLIALVILAATVLLDIILFIKGVVCPKKNTRVEPAKY